MASKQNDLMLNILANPHMSLGDFLNVGLSANNTSLEDENVYLNSKIITENSLFQNASGEFDKVKFHLKYLEAALAMQNMALEENKGFQATFSKYNIFAPINQVDFKPLFELTKLENPNRLTRSMITLGLSGPRELTPSEIAQSQQVLDSDTGKLMDTPENMFSFNKLFSDFTGFFSDNFGSVKVLATYDDDIDINGIKRGEVGFNENLIEHYKGEYKLNDNGTYYYRTLKDGENIYGKLILHYSDILTREGSALNSVDFLDSDDIYKHPVGTLIKDASLIGAFFLPYVGEYIAGATILQLAAGLGATLGKIALGSNNSTMNWVEGLVEATNPMETRSEHSQQHNWTIENLLGMTADVVGLLYLQRLLFKYAPAIVKGKWGISEKNLETLRLKLVGELELQNKGILSGITDIAKNLKAAIELQARNELLAAAKLEEYMKSYYKTGEFLSKAYMTMLTVNDIYGEAKEAGAEDFDAALVTTGYAAMEYALLSTDIGKWILPELRAERLKNKAVVNALSKETLESFKKLGEEAATNEAAKRTYVQRLIDYGKSIAKGEFTSGWGKRASLEGGEGLLAGGFSSLFAGALAEATEETSEELLGDFSRVLFNGIEQLWGKESRLKPFENGFDRYTMSFLGGFLGGGISSATMDFSEARKAANMTFRQAVLEVIYKARNNQLDELYELIDKDKIGSDKLSAKKVIKDDLGNLIWQLAEGNDNLDFVIKLNLRRFLNLILSTLDAHGGNLSDSSLLDAQTLRDIRYRALHLTVTAGMFILHYNELITELVSNVQDLKDLNSPQTKVENNEGDLKEEKSKELEIKRKKIEDRIKELDKLIEEFTSGKLAPLFMTSALLETTPFISAPFITSTFRYFAEKEAKTKFENIPENELKEYLIKYLNYLRTTKKDDLRLATLGYLNLLDLIRDSFINIQELAKEQILDLELKDYLKNFTDTLSIFSQNILNMDDDTWVEKLQEFSLLTNIGEKLLTSLLLLRNTIIENSKLSEDKRNKMIEDAKLAFENGLIDEETLNNTINLADLEYELETSQNLEQFNKHRLELILQGLLLAALNLADSLIKLGYINGAVKSNIIALLESARNTANLIRYQLENEIAYAPADLLDYYTDLINSILQLTEELDKKIESIQKLPYTPILQNLDSFALNLNGGSVSKILELLGNIINSNRGNLSAFTLLGDTYKLINEALRVIDLYIAALEGARIDTVDPFRVGINAKGEALDKSNLWGINRVLNEVHKKSPKIENDTWKDLPEIEGEIADMILIDARSIKKLLLTYKRLYNINEGLKLNVQTRVSVKTSYLLYNRVKRLLSRIEALKDFNIAELLKVMSSLTFLEELTSKENWNINLNLEEQVKLEKERIELEDALYNFFNLDNPGLATDVEKLKNFLTLDNFKLLDSRTELLSEGAVDIDETSFIGYIASKAAIKSSDFYGKFIEIIKEGKIAPIISLELGVALLLANVLNGNVITAFTLAYREVLKERFKNSSFEERKEMLKEYGESEVAQNFFSTEEGSKYYLTHDSVPLFTNVTFIDGIPGAGKSAAVDKLVIKFLLKYYPNLVKKTWTIHGGDLEDSIEYSKKFRKDIGLEEDDNLTFNIRQLLKKISNDWNPAKLEDGKTYEIKETDYVIEDGQIVPSWKLNNFLEDEIPSIIIIDEALQLTQFDLMLIDKFARKHGIPVIMSGDLLQSKSNGRFKVPVNIMLKINGELKAKGLEPFPENFPMGIKLARNLTLHSFKLGTSMRTANNLKDANCAALQLAILDGKGDIKLHYFEEEDSIAGDFIVNPSDIDYIIKLIDKILPHLEDGEKINYAYDKPDSKILETLKNNKKYADRINFIRGTALGQEGNYWIIEPNYSIRDNSPAIENIEDFLSDLYTGISRSKIAGIVISPENLNGGVVTLSNILDLETHEITYSPQAIEKYAKKRVEILEKVLENTGDIEYVPREEKEPVTIKSVTPLGLNPSNFEEEAQRLKAEGKIDTEDSSNSFEVGDILTIVNYDQNGKEVWRGLVEVIVVYDPELDGHGGIKVKALDGQTFDYSLRFVDHFFGLVPPFTLGAYSEIVNNSRLGNKIPYIGEENTNSEELISTFDVANDESAKELLDESTLEDNVNSDEEIEPIDLSLETFNFFLFSNATFELGTTEVDRQGNTYKESPIQGRIDSVNGLKNCPKAKAVIGQLDRVEKLLGNLRRYILSIKTKSDLEAQLLKTLGLQGHVYVRFGIKTFEGNLNYSLSAYSKLEQDPEENLPYTRALQSPNSESNKVNIRKLVAIIGTDEKGDAIEIPILSLNNPITLLKIKDSQGNYKFPDVYNEYIVTFNRVLANTGDWKKALVEGLIAVITYTNGNLKYKALENLIKLYLATDRNIAFIKNLQWVPARNLKSFGPQLHIHRGNAYYDFQLYDNIDYVLEHNYITLDELRADPTLYVSSVYQLLDKSELNLKLSLPKHPFILYTDLVRTHDGKLISSDLNIIKEYLWQKEDPSRPQTIKLVYVLPPKFTLKEYVDSLRRFMEDKLGTPLGNQRTPYKILETIFLTDLSATKLLFSDAFGAEAYEPIYNKVFEIIYKLKDLSIPEQIKELQKVLLWPDLKSTKLTTKSYLLYVIKLLAYPGGITLDGIVVFNGQLNQKVFDQFNTIFEKSGKSLYYQSRASKNAVDIIEGIFSPVQTDANGHINDANISDKLFYVNGNISSSTFLAEEEFNRIIDDIVNNVQFVNQYGQVQSKDTRKYIYDKNSGWNVLTKPQVLPLEELLPTLTIALSILNKLSLFGITTNVLPNLENDDSIELKLAIANEINSTSQNVIAIVLPNGELILGNYLHLSPVTVNIGEQPFEGNLLYLFEIRVENVIYDVVYNPITKEAQLKERLSVENLNLNSYYEPINKEEVDNNLNKFKLLLELISTTNSFSLESRNWATKLLESGTSEEIAEFLNNAFGIMDEIANIDINDFDKSQFIDILKFEQKEDLLGCNVPINIKFI